ncbi:integral membrane protein [Colletotrichum tabaci]|uniref:Integral membrane protein n=1 Tax=Colletotrichum tabaci TaxID=1209068 RepID=A0AAV9SS79_9PEZI
MANINTTAAPVDAEWAAESNTAQILTVVTIFNFLALGCVGARLYAKVWVIKAPHMDDWMMIPAAICSVGGGWVVFVIQAQHGLGKHYRTIDPADYVKFQHAAFFSVIVSSAAGMMFLKVSIALNLLRLSPSRWYQWSLWAIIALNIFTDVVLATLPIPVVWNLQMKLKVRLCVIGILSLGYLAVAMGIIKAVYQIAFGSDMDKTFHYHIFVWGFLQIQMGIIAACAPALRPLLARILRLTSHDDYRNEDNGPSQKQKTEAAVGDQHRRTVRSGMGPPFGRGQYELDERPFAFGDRDSDRASANLGGAKVATAAFYDCTSDNGSGSEEERIVQGDRPGAANGILKTIEVTVK